MSFPLVLGLDTFGDLTHDEDDRPQSHAQTIRNVVERASSPTRSALTFGVGEHHTVDFPIDPVTLSAVRREAERRAARSDTARGVTISTSSLQLRQISGLQRS
jgi:hypothetical protein